MRRPKQRGQRASPEADGLAWKVVFVHARETWTQDGPKPKIQELSLPGACLVWAGMLCSHAAGPAHLQTTRGYLNGGNPKDQGMLPDRLTPATRVIRFGCI